MEDHADLMQSMRDLQPSRLSYIQLLQDEVERSQDRTLEKAKVEEDNGDWSGRPPSSAKQPSLPTPHSVPCGLAIAPSRGGVPITAELAADLRKIIFGNTFHVFNYEWKKAYFKFREPYSQLSYALEAEPGGCRAVQMIVQANIIKHLLFKHHIVPDSRVLHSLAEKEQEKTLAAALTDILWTAGQAQAATVCLVTSLGNITPHLGYKQDYFTERLQLFSFNEKEEVWKFIYEHIRCFKEEGSHGVILFLYSLILSRTISSLQDDLDPTTSHLLHLSLGNFVCRQALLNLLLTGRASPNVFNGTLHYGEDGSPFEPPLQGVLVRSDVGYLHWNREQVQQCKLPKVGSMLKTPRLPIWLCNINGTYSILFSPNRSLLSDWRMEHVFHLYFYNGQLSQCRTVMLTIDTHSHHWEVRQTDVQGDIEKRFPSLEMTIRTKWEGAAIDWNGTVPFF